MLGLDVVTLLINGLTLSLALGFLLIILWQDPQKRVNQSFAIFMAFVIVWNIGAALMRAADLTEAAGRFRDLTLSIMEFGFVGASVSIYIMVMMLVGIFSRRFQLLAYISLAIIVVIRLFLIVTQSFPDNDFRVSTATSSFQPLFVLFFLFFGCITLFLMWRYRRKVRSRGLATGVFVFVAGQALTFVNPELVVSTFSTNISSVGALIIGFSMIHQEIIMPLAERNDQVESIHNVSVAITSQLELDTVLKEIAIQAAGWLKADGVGVFLTSGTSDDADVAMLKLETAFNLPKPYVGMQFAMGQGMAGIVAKKRETLYIENYQRDWRHEEDFPHARETFGCVISTPLIYADGIIGVLMVIASQEGQIFDRQDVYLLELLGAQAAVVIAHSRLFDRVNESRRQLEAVLHNTESPVISVDRQLRLIFANPAAYALFNMEIHDSITGVFPRNLFPPSMKDVLKALKQDKSYVYEVVLNGQVYLSHVATLGDDHIDGWVVVLNDVTQLKELDRLKSEMVRMASHDLKNPLMGAMAYVELLEEDLTEIGQVELNQYIKTIEHQLLRMERIIRGILDLEKIKIAFNLDDECIPEIIIQSALDELRQFIEDANVTVSIDIDNHVGAFRGNRDQFERAIINIIENAIKFTLQDGIVTIKVYADNTNIVFEIADNGIGIPEDVVPRVFERFFRGQQAGVEHVTGSGLGLSLVKGTIENHSGRIWLESKLNHGTTVFVSVPSYTRTAS